MLVKVLAYLPPTAHALEHDLGLAHRPRHPSAAAHLVVAQRPPELGQVSHPLPAAVTSVTTLPGRRPEAPTSAIVSSAVHLCCKLEEFEKVSEDRHNPLPHIALLTTALKSAYKNTTSLSTRTATELRELLIPGGREWWFPGLFFFVCGRGGIA